MGRQKLLCEQEETMTEVFSQSKRKGLRYRAQEEDVALYTHRNQRACSAQSQVFG